MVLLDTETPGTSRETYRFITEGLRVPVPSLTIFAKFHTGTRKSLSDFWRPLLGQLIKFALTSLRDEEIFQNK